MEISKKIERYKELFKDDPLFVEIQRRGLIDELFKTCTLYMKVFFDSTYSTKQAAELLDIPNKEQTLLNYLNRNDFIDYINVTRQGSRGYYRYSYKSLFQFKMILLLIEHDLTPFDIASIVGTRPEYSNRGKSYAKTPVVQLSNNLSDDTIENMLINFHLDRINQTTNTLNLFQRSLELSKKKDELRQVEKEHDQSILTIKLLEDKLVQVKKDIAIATTKCKREIIQRRMFELQNAKMNKAGLFTRIKSLAVSENEIEAPTKAELEDQEEVKELIEFRKELIETIEKEEIKSEKLKEKKAQLEEKIQSMEKELFLENESLKMTYKESINDSMNKLSLMNVSKNKEDANHIVFEIENDEK